MIFYSYIGPPIIITHPTNMVTNASIGVTLSCKGSGDVPFTYHWEYSSIDEENWINLQNIHGETYSIRIAASERYRCIVSNDAGSTISNISTITILSKLYLLGLV